MFGLSFAQRHALKATVESLIVNIAPFAITAASAAAQPLLNHAGVCSGSMGPVPADCGGTPPAVYLAELVGLSALVRGVQGWLSAQHAPTAVAPGVVQGMPTTVSLEAVRVTKPATAIADAGLGIGVAPPAPLVIGSKVAPLNLTYTAHK